MTESQKIAHLKAINEEHLESLRRKDALHRAELEKRQRLEWKAHQKQLQELNEAHRYGAARDKELAQLTERLHIKETECDRLESEVNRLRSAESWRSISPASSTEDLNSQGTISKRERDMAMRNSELSFRIRTLEDNLSSVKGQKKSLEAELKVAQGELEPLKEQNMKLKSQHNELNSTLRSREKKLNQISQELLDMKSSYQSLQEEYGKQQTNLKQQVAQLVEYRTQKQKLQLKNEKLRKAYDKLSERIRELEEHNYLLQEQSFLSLPSSPVPSASIDGDELLSVSSSSSQLQEHIDQLRFDKDEMEAKHDEMEAKYDEMKTEYKGIKENYKALRHHCQQIKVKHEDDILQIQRKNSEDQLALEREVMLLRSAKSENLSDQNRNQYILISLEETRKKLLHRIKALEDFIIEQDEVFARKEVWWKDEVARLGDLLEVSVPEGMPRLSRDEVDYGDDSIQALKDLGMKDESYNVWHHSDDVQQVEPRHYAEMEAQTYLQNDEGTTYNPVSKSMDDKSYTTFEDPRDVRVVHEQETHTFLKDTAGRDGINDGGGSAAKGRATGYSDVTCEQQEHETQTHLSGATSSNQGIAGETQTYLPGVSGSNQGIIAGESTFTPKRGHFGHTNFTGGSSNIREQQEQEAQTYLQNKTSDLGYEHIGEPITQKRSVKDEVNVTRSYIVQKEQETQTDLQDPTYNVRAQPSADKVTALQENSEDTKDDIIKKHSKTIQSLKKELGSCERKNQELNDQLSNEISHGHRVEDELRLKLQQQEHETLRGRRLEDELRQTLKQQEHEISHGHRVEDELRSKLQQQEHEVMVEMQRKDHLISALEVKLEDLNNALLNMRKRFSKLEYDRQAAMKLAQDAKETLNKLEVNNSYDEKNGVVSNKLSILRDSISELLKVMKLRYLPSGDKVSGHRTLTHADNVHSERNIRLFVVVMDYDPQSLCITGKPELELPVQSGSIIHVNGEMDDNGYYYAMFNNTRGLVPANFVQEIEVHDQQLIGRVLNKNFTSSPMRHSDTESAYKFINGQSFWEFNCVEPSTSKLQEESVQSEAAFEMSGLSLQSSDISGSVKPDSSAGDQSYDTFLGLYDYNPKTSSSSENPEFELSFKEGSLLKVFGCKMSDGYYVGELNGKRGLVPANFIISTSSPILKDSSTSLLKSKKMIALYDYMPSKDSPNAYADTELEFRAGDLITVYGNMHDDGFYSGQLHDKFGLVPSNYLKEE